MRWESDAEQAGEKSSKEGTAWDLNLQIVLAEADQCCQFFFCNTSVAIFGFLDDLSGYAGAGGFEDIKVHVEVLVIRDGALIQRRCIEFASPE